MSTGISPTRPQNTLNSALLISPPLKYNSVMLYIEWLSSLALAFFLQMRSCQNFFSDFRKIKLRRKLSLRLKWDVTDFMTKCTRE